LFNKKSKPAILGNDPAFSQLIPIVQPTLPSYDTFNKEIAKILDTGMLTKGKYLQELEEKVASYIGVKHAVAVSSCTLGLLLVYKCLGFTGEVIVPSFTFMATVHPLIWNNLTPVFVDIDPETWNIDPQCVEEAVADQTSAIVAVHNFGNPANIKELQDIANKHNLKLIFDAAHGFGSRYKGHNIGSFGDVEVFSTSPTKLMTTGEGGIVATNDSELAHKIRLAREYGNPGDYGSKFPGLNARMQEFSALLGLKSLEMLESNAQQRNKIVDNFKVHLGKVPGIIFQKIECGNRSSYKDFSVAIEEEEFGLSRDRLAQALRTEGIDTRKYHDPPVHTHLTYKKYWNKYCNKLPVTESLARKIISLPLYSHMEKETVEKICYAMGRIHQYHSQINKSFI